MSQLPIIRTVSSARALARTARASGRTVGLVPTMGALHRGHQSLVGRAASECDEVVVSIFVNPLQFNDATDLEAYPRTLEADAALAREAGATALFVPSEAEMYPTGSPLTVVSVRELTQGLEGAHRPGHFDGVTTVCAKLFCACEPDRAYFGEKDYQQLRVVSRMVTDMNMGVEIVPCPLIREADGLAMSSRNSRLSAEERREALALSRGLLSAREAHTVGERDSRKLTGLVRSALGAAPHAEVEYVELVDAQSLEPVWRAESDCALLAAVQFPSARLIDNILLPPTERP